MMRRVTLAYHSVASWLIFASSACGRRRTGYRLRLQELSNPFAAFRHRSYAGQLLRATFSIQANIAEGSSKRSDREFARYIRIALGSSTESANHLILLHDLGAIDDTVFASLDSKQDDVGKMLSGLEKRLSTQKGDSP